MVLVQSKLIELAGDSDDIVGVAAVLGCGVEQVQIGVLLVHEAGNERGVRVVLGVGFLIDCAFEVVIETVLDEIALEDLESVQNVHDV